MICEGYEAGGHVGRHSTLTLAQRVLDLKRRKPSLFQNCRVILAGGIFNRETAFIAAMLGADAIQMGTAYLATREIVETGALTALYQRMILESPPGGTVVSGQGHRTSGAILEDPESGRDFIPGEGVCSGPPRRALLPDENGGDDRGEPVRCSPRHGQARRGAS